MSFDPTHHYAQQATRLTQVMFITTIVLDLVFLALVIWSSWYYLLAMLGLSLIWGLGSAFKPTTPVRDLTTQVTHTVATAEWRAFKRQYPEQVGKAGAKD